MMLAAGCGKSTGTCAAGGITLPVGLVGITGGVLWILDSSGDVKITPMGERP